jgi:hypothetical protein
MDLANHGKRRVLAAGSATHAVEPGVHNHKQIKRSTSMMNIRKKTGRRYPVLTTLAGAAMAAVMLIAPTLASAADTQPSHFTWTVTSASISGDLTLINDAATNGNPKALLYVSPNYSPGGVCGCVTDNEPIAVYYDTSDSQWSILNENDSAPPVGASFNVFVEPKKSGPAFQVTAGSTNTSGDTVYADSKTTNDKPDAILQATQVWNGAYNDNVAGVYYDTSADEWGVFNEGDEAMAAGTEYNVLVGNVGGGTSGTLDGTSGTIGADSEHYTSTVTNGDSNTFVLDTPNWDPDGTCGCVYDTSPTGVWYFTSDGGIAVFNESQANMETGVDFNLLAWNS